MSDIPSAVGHLLDEKLCSTLINSIRGIVWEADPLTFRFSFVSPHAKQILGFPLEQWIDEPDFWRNHTHPDDVEWCSDFCRAAPVKGEDHEFQYRMIAADGRIVWLHDIVTVVRSDGGSVRLRGIMFDITERREAADALKQSEQRLRLALQAANAGMWEWYPRSDEGIWSEELWKLFEMEPHSLKPSYEAWEKTIHPDDLAGAESAVQEAVANGAELNAEWRLRSHDGTVRWVMSRGQPLRDGNDQMARYIGITLDISERKRAEEVQRRERAMLHCIIDSASDLIFIKDRNSVYLGCNKAAKKFIGLSEKEQIGKTDFDFFDRERAELIREDDLRVINGGETLRAEEWVTYPDGHSVLMDTQKVPFYGSNGEIKGLVGFCRDITERNRLLETLKLREHYQRALLDNFPFAAWMKDKEGRYLAVNKQLAAYHGLQSPAELVGKTVFDFLPRDIADYITEEDRKVLLSGRTKHAEEQLPVSGVNRWFDVYQSPIIIDGQVIGTVGCNWDINERHEMEEALRDSRLRLEQIFAFLPDATFAIDMEGRVIAWNRVMEEMTGRPAAEILGKGDYEYSIPFYETRRQMLADLVISGMGKIAEEYDFLQKVGDKLSAEAKSIIKSGQLHFFSGIAAPLFDSDGKMIGAIEQIRDITELRQAEERLKESEERYRKLVELSPDAIYIHIDGILVFANAAGASLLGAKHPEELYGRQALDFVHPDHRDIVVRRLDNLMLNGDPNPVIEEIFIRLDGSNAPVDVSSLVFNYQGKNAVLVVAHDISERKKMQDELFKAQKLESLGVLAGGIAHDFNNILTGILGNLSLARVRLDPSDNIAKQIDQCEKAAIRASDLAQQLLTFSRGGEPVKRLIDPAHLIRETTSFVLHGSNVRSVIELADDHWCVEADEGQLSQVMHNILINAIQAMPLGGEVTVRVMNERIGPVNAYQLQPGDYLKITIEDQGFGISQEDLVKIFDPYFSTKSEGNGLGLASVYSIVKRHGGAVEVSSTVGVGSSFTIRLPASSCMRPEGEVGVAVDRRPYRDCEEPIQTLGPPTIPDRQSQCFGSLWYKIYIGITLALQHSIITGIYTERIPMYPQTIPPKIPSIIFWIISYVAVGIPPLPS
ncbi:MAG: PAS domain S-box protein [Geobacteraceae bacterium]|jgi:PAS domain S-box-containing protein